MASQKQHPPVGAASARQGILPAGTRAPEFSLNSTPDQKVSLSEFQGAP